MTDHTLAMQEGFDRAKANEADDRLERRRIAHRAYELLSELPGDWSVRVGLFGEWGEGKTTVCNWVSRLAEADDHITVWYNPWSAGSPSDLWIGFATKLLQTLDEHGIELESASRLRTTLGVKKWGDVPKKITDIAKSAQAMAGTGFALAESFLRISADDMRRLRAGLGGRRLIIIVDDLDRTDPELLPQLLLALREILDLPGFSFLLPLDPHVIAQALAGYNPAWGRGERFLDKILDFRIVLPPATVEQRHAMFLDELAAYCPFVPAQELADLDEVLPANPRKLKALVRNLVVYRAEAERHGPGELDWRSLLYASMIRMESEAFYAAFFKATFEAVGVDPQANLPEGAAGQPKSADLDRLIETHAPADEATRARLRLLATRWWEHCGRQGLDRVAYQMRLAEQPRAVSWREFRRFYDLWSESRSLDRVADAIADHAAKLGQPAVIVTADVASSLLSYYEDRLYAAAYMELAEEHAAVARDAIDSLDLFGALCRDGLSGIAAPAASPELFERMLDTALTWIEFDANPLDAEARERERVTLTDMMTRVDGDPGRYVDAIDARLQAHSRSRERVRLLKELLAVSADWQRDQVIARLSTEQGLIELFAPDQHRSMKSLLFNPEGPLWTAKQDEAPASELMARAEAEAAIQKNALEFLRLAVFGMDKGIGIPADIVRRFVATPDAIEKVWRAATARPLQFRNLQKLRELRQRLIRFGADEEALPPPNWLEAGSGSRKL